MLPRRGGHRARSRSRRPNPGHWITADVHYCAAHEYHPTRAKFTDFDPFWEFVAGPLKRSDCSLVSDGAAALVISRDPVAGARVQPVRWRSRTQVNEYLPLSRRDPTKFEGAALAWQRGMDTAGVTLSDLHFVETHDCFTIAELLEYEAMGLRGHGQGARAILDGDTRRDGKLPVNPSGGLKSRGHPIGATGVSQHVMAAMQLTGTAGDMQLPRAGLGAVFIMGGAAVANYLSILEAV